MLVGLRVLLLLAVPLAAIPFLAWALEPGTVLVHPERATSVVHLTYLVLGSHGAGAQMSSTTVVWFYGVLALAGLQAVVLALILVTRAWARPDLPLLAGFLLAGAAYFGVYFIAIPHRNPPWLGDWLLDGGAPVAGWVVPFAFGLGLAAFVHFAARFPRRLTVQDVVAYHAVDARWKASHYRRLVGHLSSAYQNLVGRIGLPTDTPDKASTRARRAFELSIEQPGVWIAFPAALLTHHVLERATEFGPGLAFMSFPVIGLSAVYLAHVLFGVQREVAVGHQVKQVTWLASGLRAALFLWLVFGVASFALTWRGDAAGWGLYMASVFVFGPLLMAASVVTALGAAVLVGGAIDPELALRRATVYTTLLLCFAFLFAVAEQWLSDVLVDRVGVSDRIASMLLGAAVAVGIAPLRAVVDRLVSRVFAVDHTAGKLSGTDSI